MDTHASIKAELPFMGMSSLGGIGAVRPWQVGGAAFYFNTLLSDQSFHAV